MRNSAIRKAAAPSTGGEMMAPRPPAASRPPAAFFSKPDLLHQRIGDGADRHGGGDARARRAAEQERRQHHGAAGAVGLVAHQRHREVDEELAGAGMLQERAVDREQDDQRGRDVDRNAENALERDEQMADELADVEAAMRPGRRQIGTGKRIGDEQERDDRNDPAGGAPRRLEQEDDEDHAEHDVEAGRHGRAVGEFLAALDGVDQDGSRRRCRRRRPTSGCDRGSGADSGNSRKLSISTKATCA